MTNKIKLFLKKGIVTLLGLFALFQFSVLYAVENFGTNDMKPVLEESIKKKKNYRRKAMLMLNLI
jgi:hypothetical protein